MKLYLVNIGNVLNSSSYEPFFYKNIKDGTISLYDHHLDTLDQLDSLYKWITEDINRNPFSVDQASVIFIIHRNLEGRRNIQDYDIIAKIYIHELLANKLDKRFSYLCFYQDSTGRDRNADVIYREDIDKVNATFSDESMSEHTLLPSTLPDGEDPKTYIRTFADGMSNRILAEFYLQILAEIEDEMETQKPLDDKDWYGVLFRNRCFERVANIITMRTSFYSGDISQKLETELKTVRYICLFADSLTVNEGRLDKLCTDYFSSDQFERFRVDADSLKSEIATYEKRLSSWKPSGSKQKDSDDKSLNFAPSDQTRELEEELEKISVNDVQNALRFAMIDADGDSSKAFVSLKQLIQNADMMLRAFCERRVQELRSFYMKNPMDASSVINVFSTDDDAQKTERESAAKMNKYVASELPGYSAELELEQELELRREKIRETNKYLESMKKIIFMLTLVFTVGSVGSYYYGLQYSVFSKERTMAVFVSYIGVTAILFLSAYIIVRWIFNRRIDHYFRESVELVRVFLNGYKDRAREFQDNLYSSVKYYCAVDGNNKKAKRSQEEIEYKEREQWHRRKINAILKNLEYFNSYISGAETQEERTPQLNLLDDAVHNDFYQLRVF